MRRQLHAALAWFVLVLAPALHADIMTFYFDPNTFIDRYSLAPSGALESDPNDTYGNLQHQTDPRKIYESYDTDTAYRTWVTSDQANYQAWLAQLTPEEGISYFNVWLSDNSAVQHWGEFLVGSSIAATADPQNDWNVELVANPFHPGWKIAAFSTTNPDKYLRPGGADIGLFSITTDAMLWDGAGENPPRFDNVADEPWYYGMYGLSSYTVSPNPGEYKLWFGADVVDDRYWGGLEGTFLSTAVPEPGAFVLLVTGLGVLAFARRRRKTA